MQHLFGERIEGLLPLKVLILQLPSTEINKVLESQIVHKGTVGGVSAGKKTYLLENTEKCMYLFDIGWHVSEM